MSARAGRCGACRPGQGHSRTMGGPMSTSPTDVLRTSLRDLTCADARPEHVGRTTSLSGWVDRRRDLGQLIFLDLRDRYGITQVVIDAQEPPEAHATAPDVRSEYVLRVRGTVAPRLPGTENAKLAT